MERKIHLNKPVKIAIVVMVAILIAVVGVLGVLFLLPKVEKGPKLSYGENTFIAEKINTYYECVVEINDRNLYKFEVLGATVESFSDLEGNKLTLKESALQNEVDNTVLVDSYIEAGEYILKLYVTDRNVEVICSIYW